MEDTKAKGIKRYKKLRLRLEMVASLISITVAYIVADYFKLLDNKFFSWDTAIFLAIVAVIAIILSKIAEVIADSWYKKKIDKDA